MFDADYWARRCEQARNQLSAVTAERDALANKLAALQKRVANAKTIEAKTAWNGETGVCRLFPKRQLKPGTYALVRLEDGE